LDYQMADAAAATPKPKSSLLPALVILFVISYGLLCTLVVEQGSTIDSQRFLIRQLLGDSTQLSAMKGRANQKKQAEAQARANAQAQAQANAQGQAQAPAAPADSAKNNRNAGKLRRPGPQKPPRDASEMADERRNLISI
jgi:pyruvate/2-oxoglutarate dehydrogenase complex dihydrolipoamide acyltransferase (E2) component